VLLDLLTLAPQSPPRLRQSDLEAVRKLLRDGIAFGYDKVLRDRHLYSTTTTAEEDALLGALRALVELAAQLLELRAVAAEHAAGMQLMELDGELLQLINLLGALFTRETPLHEYHNATEMAGYDDEPQGSVWAEPITVLPACQDGDTEELLEEREYEWLVHLINYFGDCKGFYAIHTVRRPGARKRDAVPASAAAAWTACRWWGSDATSIRLAGMWLIPVTSHPRVKAVPFSVFQLCHPSDLRLFTPTISPNQLLNGFPHRGNLSIYMVAALTHVLARAAEVMPESTLCYFKQVGSGQGGGASNEAGCSLVGSVAPLALLPPIHALRLIGAPACRETGCSWNATVLPTLPPLLLRCCLGARLWVT
jgi:hypothetical protein